MKISVVIPFYNEQSSIETTLESLYTQSHQPNEILLVDSGSSDNTRVIIDEWIKTKSAKTYKVIFDGNMSPSSSINTGVKYSSNALIAYIDCGLKIPNRWIEENLTYMKKHNVDIVSNCIYTTGENIIDKSFISQTYGYASKVPCFPGSLLKKKAIEDCGYLLKNTRASYDVDFLRKCRMENITRAINHDVTLEYIGTNYSNSLINGAKKIFSYSLDSWLTYSKIKPICYILFYFVLMSSFIFDFYFITLLMTYLLIRGFIIPAYKSNQILFSKNIAYLITIPICGLIIDLSRVCGYLYSLIIR
tara:strand:+ start:2930 stop:3841 length:912 start_codon:yes stop_codon:yes gene_type:complete